MNKPTHTPGPWTLKPNGVISGGKPIQLPNGEAVQQVAMATYLDDGDREANARLIAAAPELLEALRNAATLLNAIAPLMERQGSHDYRHGANLVAAAIAKAEGQ